MHAGREACVFSGRNYKEIIQSARRSNFAHSLLLWKSGRASFFSEHLDFFLSISYHQYSMLIYLSLGMGHGCTRYSQAGKQ